MSYRQLMAVCFLLNGIALLGNKTVGMCGLTASIPFVLLVMYAVASAITLGPMIGGRKRTERRSIAIGLVGGVGTSVGLACNMMAASMMPAYIVFPLVNGGTLLLVMLAGGLLFKERIGPYGIAGFLCGIGAIILLST